MAMTEEVKLGKPKYEQNTKNYFAFKKDQNTFILRILPPMFNLLDEGKWSVYHRVEFGHVGTDNRMKPFLSPRVVNYDKMVEVESESHTRRETVKAQLEAAKAAGNKAVEEQCNNFLRKYNQAAHHYMNAVDLQGVVGLFKIGHRGFQALKAEIDRLRSEGCDPVAAENGRYFVFSRSGKGRDTLYTVKEYKQKTEMQGPSGVILVDAPFPHNVEGAILKKLSTDAFELESVYPKISAEEESRIINEGATAVDAILGKKKEESKANPASQAPAQEVPAQQPVLQKQEAPAQEAIPAQQVAEPTPEAVANVPTETGTAEINTNTGEILNETPAASAETASSPQTPAAEANPAANVADMSEADFFKMVESGNL
jgi:hypothetical protein